jgi:hypothetical protein
MVNLDRFNEWLNEDDSKPDFAILKSEGSVGPLYTLLDVKRLVNFAQKLVSDYQAGIKDPDISEDDLINGLIIISSVRVAEPTDSIVDYYGYCMGASQVKVSAVNSHLKGQRYGEMLYSYVFGDHPNGLMPDREDVSPSAQKLWNRIANIAQVKTVSDEEGTYNSFDNKENPQTKTKEDDCIIHTDKSKEALNKAYVMQGLDPKKLMSKAELAMSNTAEILQGLWEEDSIRYMIEKSSMMLFDRAMGIQEGNKTWGPNKKSKKTLPSPYKKETSKSFPYTKDRTKGGVAATYKRRSKRIGGASIAPGETFGPMEGKKK